MKVVESPALLSPDRIVPRGPLGWRPSLAWQLFAAILLPVAVAIALIAAAVALNMRTGFSRYLVATDLAALDGLVAALAGAPDAEGGWPSLNDPHAWAAFVRLDAPDTGMGSDLDSGLRRPATPGAGFAVPDRPPPPAPLLGDPRRGSPRLPFPFPSGPPPPRPGQAPPLHERLALLDASGEPVTPLPPPGGVSADRPIPDVDGRPLGTLRLSVPADPIAPADRLFLSRQRTVLVVVASIALGLATLAAAWLARRILVPVRAVGDHVTRLAAGDLSTRLMTTRRDELGRMIEGQNRLAEGLEASRARERAFVADASHELRTPIAVLRGEIEALEDGVRPLTRDALAPLHRSVMRLARLADDLGALARGEEGRSMDVRPVDLGALVQDAGEDARPAIEGTGLVLRIGAGADIVVAGDAGRLRQVLDNLLENARRYTDAPGEIHARCDADEADGNEAGRARIVVEDTAPVPPDEAIPALFDRFGRHEPSRSRLHGGSGLGLSICRSLVRAHGGAISAAPSPLGGLRVTVLLPLAARPEPRP